MKYFWLFINILLTFSTSALGYENVKPFVVVIDPGHGGRDPGSTGVKLKLKEKDINLAVALKVGELIASNHAHTRVIYTRQKDVFVPLNDRAEKANKVKADLFISIHTNASDRNPLAHGTEIYTLGLSRSSENLEVARRENSVILLEENYQQTYEGYDPNSDESFIMFQFMQNQFMEQSISFAAEIQSQFIVNAKRNDRGVRQAGFLVLRRASMPSVLIELGFLTNIKEEAYLNTKEAQRTLARCIYNAFDKYKKEYDRKMNIPTTAAAPNKTPASPPPVSSTPEVQQENKPKMTTTTADTPPVKPSSNASQDANAKQQETAKATATTPAGSSGSIVYKIQILAAGKPLPKNSPRLKGYREQYYVENGLYKYTVGETSNWEEAQRIKKSVAKDFEGVFIVKFKNGQRIKE